MSASQKTQEATPLRRRQAEREGFVPQWRDLRLLLWVIAVWGAAIWFLSDAVARLQTFMSEVLAAVATQKSWSVVLSRGGEVVAYVLAPPLLMVLTAAALPMLMRGPSGWHPQLGLRNPFTSAFDKRARVDLAWNVGKGLVLLLLFAGALALIAPGLSSIPLHQQLEVWPHALVEVVKSTLGRSVLAMLVLAPLGLWIEHLMHRRALRMSVEEQRRERRREEVDPRMLMELRQRSRAADDDFDSALEATTHALSAPGVLILLRLVVGDSSHPRLLQRLMGMPMQEARAALHARKVPVIVDLALAERLTPIAKGDAIPRVYYPALASSLRQARRIYLTPDAPYSRAPPHDAFAKHLRRRCDLCLPNA